MGEGLTKSRTVNMSYCLLSSRSSTDTRETVARVSPCGSNYCELCVPVYKVHTPDLVVLVCGIVLVDTLE